jgi:hypothetical protein
MAAEADLAVSGVPMGESESLSVDLKRKGLIHSEIFWDRSSIQKLVARLKREIG